MSAASGEMEMLRKAIRLLHSPHPNSATELRMMLDEAIKQRHGPEKMLSNTMLKRCMEEEANFPGRAATPPPTPSPQPAQQEQETDEIINLTNSPEKPLSDSPDTIMDSDDAVSGGGAGTTTLLSSVVDDDVNLKEFGDLNCCVCSEMMFTATNRLIECSKCGALYHQECHKPPITDEEAAENQERNEWQCDSCYNKPSTSKAAGIVVAATEEPTQQPIALITKIQKPSGTSSRSSSSSNSSSSFAVAAATSSFQQEPQASTSAAAAAAAAATPSPPAVTPPITTSNTTSKHHHKSSKSSHKEEQRSSSSSSSKPTINIVSAADRSSSHSSRKSSSSKSSKHHESSSSKRKSK